jgi:hypothetical protein
MRAWFSGKTLAFQANDAGSIPAARFYPSLVSVKKQPSILKVKFRNEKQ